ncbi:MAG TPA: hypothetical protein VLX56_00490 [Nitrososphaerales archaeon]|nr:hypothetical protein [Nitrososphaerales archaeon]
MQVTNTAKLAAVAATVAAVMLAYSAVIAPATAQTATSTSNSASSTTPVTSGGWGGQGGHFAPFQAGAPLRGGGGRGGGFFRQSLPSLTVGQTITVTSTQGEYFLASDHTENGTASGTMTFTVTGKLTGGYTLSITSGSLVVNGTTYTVSSGTAQMGPDAAALVGQGATSSSGTFLVRSTAHGNFAGSSATMSVDLSAGTTEYLVFLAGGITG